MENHAIAVERANQNIEEILASWVKDNNITNWSNGVRFVQFIKNRAFHSGIKQSPYKAMFGIEPRARLTTTALPSVLLTNIHEEDDLHKIIEQMNAEQGEGEAEEEEKAPALLADTSSNISSARKEAQKNLKKQTEIMKKISAATNPAVDIGGNDVTIPIPDVDSAKADLRNIIGVVIERN